MAYEGALCNVPGIKAGADLSAAQFLAVKVDTDGDVVLAGAGEVALGILQDKPAADGRAATVAAAGVSKCVFGADSVTPGMLLAADANGKLIEAVTGDFVIGICREGGDTDEIGSVILTSSHIVPA